MQSMWAPYILYAHSMSHCLECIQVIGAVWYASPHQHPGQCSFVSYMYIASWRYWLTIDELWLTLINPQSTRNVDSDIHPRLNRLNHEKAMGWLGWNQNFWSMLSPWRMKMQPSWDNKSIKMTEYLVPIKSYLSCNLDYTDKEKDLMPFVNLPSISLANLIS